MIEFILVGSAALFLASTATFVAVETAEAFASRRRPVSLKTQIATVSAQAATDAAVVQDVQTAVAQNYEEPAPLLKAA